MCKRLKYLSIVAILLFSSCNLLDTKVDVLLTQEDIDSDYNRISNFGYAPYVHIPNGFRAIDNNIEAPMSDEAAQTYLSSDVQLFNKGSWNDTNNPNDVYRINYHGIRKAIHFIGYSNDYKKQLLHNRDTITDKGYSYQRDVKHIAWLRAESRVLIAFYYFELMKRYGGVPLITESISPYEKRDPTPRSSIEEIVNHSIKQIDYVLDSLQTDWKSYDVQLDGRFTKGSAMALKSRILLYAASPLYNKSDDLEKWKKSAKAAYDIIALGKYSLSDDYQSLFIRENSILDNEIIMAYRIGASNDFEKKNYPIGTTGGNSGVTPSHNIVSAYEDKGTRDQKDPYLNRDPRLNYSIVTNNSVWNGRVVEIWDKGKDDFKNPNTSRTGYYLKKFLNEDLNLTKNENTPRSWVMFRYAEVLLNYAESMNEAYGPDNDNGYGLSSRDAINMIRGRKGVEMPEVVASDKTTMREKIKHERRIELAFENHRYWDLKRWKDAEKVLNQPILGVKCEKNEDLPSHFLYSVFTVENRKFDSPKMYFYPIPKEEVDRTNNIVEQNPGW